MVQLLKLCRNSRDFFITTSSIQYIRILVVKQGEKTLLVLIKLFPAHTEFEVNKMFFLCIFQCTFQIYRTVIAECNYLVVVQLNSGVLARLGFVVIIPTQNFTTKHTGTACI